MKTVMSVPDYLIEKCQNAVRDTADPTTASKMRQLYRKFTTIVNNLKTYPELEWHHGCEIERRLSSYEPGKAIYLVGKIPKKKDIEEMGDLTPHIVTCYSNYSNMLKESETTSALPSTFSVTWQQHPFTAPVRLIGMTHLIT